MLTSLLATQYALGFARYHRCTEQGLQEGTLDYKGYHELKATVSGCSRCHCPTLARCCVELDS